MRCITQVFLFFQPLIENLHTSLSMCKKAFRFNGPVDFSVLIFTSDICQYPTWCCVLMRQSWQSACRSGSAPRGLGASLRLQTPFDSTRIMPSELGRFKQVLHTEMLRMQKAACMCVCEENPFSGHSHTLYSSGWLRGWMIDR